MAQSSNGWWSDATPALLTLAGVLIGALVFFGPPWTLLALLGALFLTIVARKVGRDQFPAQPVLGRCLMETWALSAVLAGALATTFAFWLLSDADLSGLVPPNKVKASKLDALTGIVTGAVLTSIAAIVTKGISEGSGPFSVADLFKDEVDKLAGALVQPVSPRLVEALQKHAVAEEKPQGWGFAARAMRARVIAEELKKRTS
jgi:hypothetical protein